MKIKLLALLLPLAAFITACDKHTEQAVTTEPAAKEITRNTAKSVEPNQSAKQQIVMPVKKPQATASKNEKTAPVMQTTAEALADVSTYGREVTKTQVSKSRTRAQAAEDEMMKDLAPVK